MMKPLLQEKNESDEVNIDFYFKKRQVNGVFLIFDIFFEKYPQMDPFVRRFHFGPEK